MYHHAYDDEVLTALECAERTGVSIRALRLYEQHGLIAPRRTVKQWRLYGKNDIARLTEILALKTLDLSLREIASLLHGTSNNFAQTLALQREALTEARNRAERGLSVIDKLQAKSQTGTIVSVDDLIHLAKETNMSEPSKDSLAWRCYEQMRPRVEVAIDMALLDDYCGAYETNEGSVYIVSRRDNQLLTRLMGQSDLALYPESETDFFMKGLPVQIVFQHSDKGQVYGLVHHQNGVENHANKIDLEQALEIEAAFQNRIRNQTQLPHSEDILRHVIEAQTRGEFDRESMVPSLALMVGHGIEEAQKKLEQAGRIKDVSFKGVLSGIDVYDVTFEHAKMEWSIGLTYRGKIDQLYYRYILSSR